MIHTPLNDALVRVHTRSFPGYKPDSGVGRYNLARLLLKMGRLREALTEAKEAHRLGQARAVGLIHRIRAKLAAGGKGGK